MFLRRFLYLALLAWALAACSKQASDPLTLPTLTPGGEAVATEFVLPPAPAASVTPAGSPTPFVSFEVSPAVDGLMLRSGPGTHFYALRMLEADIVLTVQGKAPGGEWIQVTDDDETEGWVFAELVKSAVNLQAILVIEPEGLTVIRGRVVDVLGTPMQGIEFEIAQDGDEDSIAAVSDPNGEFFAFLPEEADGAWTVRQSGVACKSNVWADEGCKTYKPGYSGTVEPQTRAVTLPQDGVLEFTWK